MDSKTELKVGNTVYEVRIYDDGIIIIYKLKYNGIHPENDKILSFTDVNNKPVNIIDAHSSLCRLFHDRDKALKSVNFLVEEEIVELEDYLNEKEIEKESLLLEIEKLRNRIKNLIKGSVFFNE